MPRIKNIQTDNTIHADDKVLGSDVTGVTRNFKISDIAAYVETANSGIFKHHQNAAASTWTITHNLNLENYLPNISITIGSGTYQNVQATGIVTYVNKNELTISFSSDQTGFAYVKK